MAMDLKQFKQDYDKYSLEQKIQTVSTMLEVLLGRWENFDNIYNFIKNYPDLVIESELDEVFAILLLGMYENQQDNLKEAESKLDWIMSKMKQLREQEKQEREQESAEEFLDSSFSKL